MYENMIIGKRVYDLNHQRSAGNIISENLTQLCRKLLSSVWNRISHTTILSMGKC